MGVDPKALAMLLMQKNPRMAQNPIAQQMMQALQTGDNEKGETLARNLCQSMGVNPEQAAQMAQQFFGNMRF